MTSHARVLAIARMHGHELARRRVAVGLLVAIPLCFYLTSAGGDLQAPATGGIGMAFSISGTSLFSIISARRVDQRLVLAGYRPSELLIGRLAMLLPTALAIAGAFGALMIVRSHPARPWLVLAGLAAVAIQAVPFGLAVGAAVPRELEGTLVVIGAVGVQLATAPNDLVARLLPFNAPRQLIMAGVGDADPVATSLVVSLACAAGYLAIAVVLTARRTRVRVAPLRLS